MNIRIRLIVIILIMTCSLNINADDYRDIMKIAPLINCVKKGDVNITALAKSNGYQYKGIYHDPDLADYYYNKVYYKNCKVRKDGTAYRFFKGNSSVIIAASVGFGPCISLTLYSKKAYNYYLRYLIKKLGYQITTDSIGQYLVKEGIAIDLIRGDHSYTFTIRRNIQVSSFDSGLTFSRISNSR